MRMRKVKNLHKRLSAASAFLIESPGELRGNWIQRLMPGASALEVELGCGKGAFLCEQAGRHPDRLFVGFEKIPDAALKGMERAAREELPNVRFVIEDAATLADRFAPGEADMLHLNFSDPWPHRRHAARRLTHRSYLALYAQVLKEGGRLAFKTDNVPLFDFTLAELESAGWKLLDSTRSLPPGGENVQTEYEARFRAQGVPICAVTAVKDAAQAAPLEEAREPQSGG